MSYSFAKLLLSIVLLLWYLFLPQYGFPDDGLLGHFLYSFCHVNVWHLSVNILCLWMLSCDLHILTTFLSSVLCSFLPCFTCEATLGFSGVLFGIVGMSWGIVGRFMDMFWRNKWFLVVPFFIPHINAFIHVYCMLCGWLIGRVLWQGRTLPRCLGDWL